MDWIVFGDDWSGHPSTTQHLVRAMPQEDRVVWIDSIGMRAPQLSHTDIKRLRHKAQRLLQPHRSSLNDPTTTAALEHVRPAVLPFHLHAAARWYNKLWLGTTVRQRLRQLGVTAPPVVLASVPTAAFYLDALPHRGVAYLRLDDYPKLPGCDRGLATLAEQEMFHRADLIFGTARSLLPTHCVDKCHYLPQGVNWEHFAQTSPTPPHARVLGFFGLLAEWIDFELIENVARAAPNWQLEFVGPVRHVPDSMRQLKNVRILPPISFASLPNAIAGWTAAWIPFRISALTEAVNPLKIREYLAAGLPAHCTPLPEVVGLSDVFISAEAQAIVAWMERCLSEDTDESRQQRRNTMRTESWTARYHQLRDLVTQHLTAL